MLFTEHGFLETDFLSTEFLGPKAKLGGGLQFFALTSTTSTGVQFEGKPNKSLPAGIQFESLSTQPSPTGLQYEFKILDTPAPIGIQFLSNPDAPIPAGVQFHAIVQGFDQGYGLQFHASILDYPVAKGFQFLAKKLLGKGIQFRSIFYNINRLRILCDYASRGTDALNWTTNSQNPGDYDINNVNSDILEKAYRSLAPLNVRMDCDTQIPQGSFVDTFCMLNHNLTTSANVLLIGSNTSDFSVIGTTIPISVSLTNLYYIAPEIPNSGYRYWRILIDDATNPDGFVQVGIVLFGSAKIFQGECFSQPIKLKRKHFSQTIETEGFTTVSNDRALRKELSLDFNKLSTLGANYTTLVDIMETYTTTHKCLWIPDPRYPKRYAIYGKLTELPDEDHIDNGIDAAYASLSLTIDEAK